MWKLTIVELDNYIDNQAGGQKQEVVENYQIESTEDLADFLLNVKKNLNSNPEFFCQVCGFWTSYQIVLEDSKGKILCVRNLFDLFMDNNEMVWDPDKITVKQLQKILAAGLV